MRIAVELHIVFIFLLAGNVTGQTNCSVGTLIDDLAEATLLNVSGMLFLDIGNPAPCSGLITSWHFCHYPINSNQSRDYTAVLQIWRAQGNQTGTYSREFEMPVTKAVPQRTPEDLSCVHMLLEVTNYIPIEENDILAAFLPRSGPIRMVSQNLSNSELYGIVSPGQNIGQLTEITPTSNGETRDQLGIHLSADIVNFTTTTDTTDMTMTTITVNMNTDQTDLGNSTTEPTLESPTNSTDSPPPVPGGLSGGEVAGIVIVLLILIGTAAAVAIVVVVVLWYKKYRTSAWEAKMKKKDFDSNSFENAIYEEADAPVRANSAMARYLNSTAFTSTDPTTDYEIPISTKSSKGGLEPPTARRNLMESMYIEMDSAEGAQRTGNEEIDSVDSFDTYPDPQTVGNYEVQKRYNTRPHRNTDDVFDIYRSFGPDNEIYCQFMEETVSQTSSLPHGVVQQFDPYADPPSNEEDIHRSLSQKTRTINRNKIDVMEEIGSGQFAFVHKALWMEKTGTSLMVAVKTLHSMASQEEKIKLLQEAVIMGQFIHPNVVRLIGVVKSDSETSLVTEYCAKGDLSVFLKDMSPGQGKQVPSDTSHNLLSYSQQVALAMHYLSSKGFVHRDLAARNIFVTQENICKLGDFGMSRDLANAEYYLSQGGVIPVRWTAPEAIYYSKYSTASDVWSYGCLLFEIWSIGRKPFGGLPNTEVLETIKTGYRLPPPPGCPETFYKIMINCWHPESASRPAFRDILESLLKDDKEVLNVPSIDASSNPQAEQLGAPLKAGKGMYITLQHTYLSTPPKNKRETIYEAIELYTSGNFQDSFPKAPLTSQSSFSKGTPPPLPSTPIPKAPLTQKGSILSIGSPAITPGTPPLPLSPIPTHTKPAVPQKPPVTKNSSTASLSSHPLLSPLHLTKSPLAGKLRGPVDIDEVYDDIVGVMSSNSTAHHQGECIYDDIAVGPSPDSIPKTSIYETPTDAQASSDPTDIDYEDI